MGTKPDTEHLEEEIRSLRLQLAEAQKATPTFGLVWTDRPDPAQEPMSTRGVSLTLQNQHTTSSGENPTTHLLIEGDNLVALRALRDSHTQKIDLIYIDPPYNTGNTRKTGFTYSDRFRTPEDEERHSSWLSMMNVRLQAARDLLKPTGSILISIDDKEVHHLRVLCDQIFGEHNFIAQMVWDGGNIKNNARYISGTHEYVLVYARSLAALTDARITWREPRPGTDLLTTQYEKLKAVHGNQHDRISAELKKWVKTAPLSKRLKVFTGVDDRGLYTYADLSAPGGKGARYDVIHPSTGKPCTVPSRGWGYTPERMQELLDDNRILFGPDETAQPMRKLYLADKTDQVRRSILEYPARSSTHLIEHMLGKRGTFNNPKNLDMMADLINLIAPPDATILDFFAGSGTTGHAVLALNAADGGNRKFILVTNNENNICDEVTLPRLQAAITGQWGNGRKETPLGGTLLVAQARILDTPRSFTVEEMTGLAFLHTWTLPETNTHTVTAHGNTTTVFGWDGQGRKADAQRTLTRLTKRADTNTEIVLLSERTRELEMPDTTPATHIPST